MTTQAPDPYSTHWSRIDALYGQQPESAWQWFVGRYRPFVREVLFAALPKGADVPSAEGEFWGYLFLSKVVERADRHRRFRALLFGTLRNFARRWRDSRGLEPLPNDALDALMAEDTAAATATRLWAQNVLRNGLDELRKESPASAEALEIFYGIGKDTQEGPARQGPEVAERLGLSPQGIYMHLYRARARLRHCIEAELRDACADEEAFQDEMRLLLRITAAKAPGLME